MTTLPKKTTVTLPMELGFLEDEDDGLLLRESTSDFVQWDGGIAGGLEPIWLAPPIAPANRTTKELLQCRSCHDTLAFLIQVYAPLDDVDAAFHRDLSVFACPNCQTGDSAICVRTQLPKDNAFYPSGEDEVAAAKAPVPDRKTWTIFGKDKPSVYLKQRFALVVESEEVATLEEEDEDDDDDSSEDEEVAKPSSIPQVCVICAAPTKNRCSACQRRFYCCKDHQAQDWKAGHKQQCLDFQDEKTTQRDLDQAASMGNSNTLDHLSQGKDKEFKRFMRKTSTNPDQVLRYYRWPVEDRVPLWTSSQNVMTSKPPKCERCGSPREFEMQITPQFLNHFQGTSDMDFGTIVIFTCPNSCGGEKAGELMQEFAYRQGA